MKTILRLTLAFVAAGSLFAAEQTWTGAISDSACGLSHAKMMAEHKALANDKACTLGCIKAGGKYVFVTEGKVYGISNQDFKSLEMNAGEMVSLTGELNGDTITVAKIAAAKINASR